MSINFEKNTARSLPHMAHKKTKCKWNREGNTDKIFSVSEENTEDYLMLMSLPKQTAKSKSKKKGGGGIDLIV